MGNGRKDEKFISDNPFRRLNVGSDTPLLVLKRLADAADKAARVGMSEPALFDEEFGSDNEEIQVSVRRLATNPIELTIHRLVWPRSERLPEFEVTPLEDNEDEHATFVASWIDFCSTDDSDSLQLALETWNNVDLDGIRDDELLNHIINDGEQDSDKAWEIVLEAQKQLRDHLLQRASQLAVRRWDEGDRDAALSIVQTVLGSPIDDEAEEKGLSAFVEIGNNLGKAIQAAGDQIPVLTEIVIPSPPIELELIELLIESFGERHPAARNWAALRDGWGDDVARALRKYALERNSQGDNVGALRTARAALEQANLPQLKDRLTNDISELNKLIADEKREQGMQGLSPIQYAPMLRTVNGIGATVYGSSEFPGDKSLVFKIHFFVFAFVPIFPLGRYLVRELPGNEYQFYARSSWTSYMKWHLALALGLILWGIVAIANSSSDSNGNSPSYNSSYDQSIISEASNSPSSEASAFTEASPEPALSPTEIAKREDDQRELDSLRAETATANWELDATETKLSGLKAGLDRSKEEIDALDPDLYDQGEVDAYNAKVRRYESRRRSYNREVDRHNRAVEGQRAKLKRMEDLERA